ncbi:YdcH family protein [Azospirillum sp.]|uniref:YdcH family protein n=1 Tax=Azospirillum sp. TaxID=34012 RepID=UPI002D6A1C0C|nr:YdcH family protein [Azospirillum sp.]HYD71203.1 YdcH family protein [Azospirillum sp.]
METAEPSAIQALRQRHADIEEMIRTEYGRPRPDDLTLKRLKLEKLHVKEQLDQMRMH